MLKILSLNEMVNNEQQACTEQSRSVPQKTININT